MIDIEKCNRSEIKGGVILGKLLELLNKMYR